MLLGYVNKKCMQDICAETSKKEVPSQNVYSL
jgi:hypothetical protein